MENKKKELNLKINYNDLCILLLNSSNIKRIVYSMVKQTKLSFKGSDKKMASMDIFKDMLSDKYDSNDIKNLTDVTNMVAANFFKVFGITLKHNKLYVDDGNMQRIYPIPKKMVSNLLVFNIKFQINGVMYECISSVKGLSIIITYSNENVIRGNYSYELGEFSIDYDEGKRTKYKFSISDDSIYCKLYKVNCNDSSISSYMQVLSYSKEEFYQSEGIVNLCDGKVPKTLSVKPSKDGYRVIVKNESHTYEVLMQEEDLLRKLLCSNKNSKFIYEFLFSLSAKMPDFIKFISNFDFYNVIINSSAYDDKIVDNLTNYGVSKIVKGRIYGR